jgi:hypothetical protein
MLNSWQTLFSIFTLTIHLGCPQFEFPEDIVSTRDLIQKCGCVLEFCQYLQNPRFGTG